MFLLDITGHLSNPVMIDLVVKKNWGGSGIDVTTTTNTHHIGMGHSAESEGLVCFAKNSG